MSFYRKIKYFLVHTLMHSNKAAQQLIDTGAVALDGVVTYENCLLSDEQEIKVNGNIARQKKEFVYLRFHKPAGLQSSLNTGVPQNISGYFSQYQGLSIGGRLDKASEGLLILSNDGKWIDDLCNAKFEKEKEYLVELDKEVDQVFVQAFANGVSIGRYTTKACQCELLNKTTVRVVLTEGKNRQIRRMCAALGYQVTGLKRIRIHQYTLNGLLPGQSEPIERMRETSGIKFERS